MATSFSGDWDRFPKDLRQIGSVLKEIWKRATRQNALMLVAAIKRGITSQAPGGIPFRKLADSTKDRKGSSKALIAAGDLRRSITATFFKGGEVAFVGVNRNASATAKDGKKKDLFNIAKVHEYGSGKREGQKGYVPMRPFMRPTLRQTRPDVIKHYDRVLKGALSKFKGGGR